VEYSPVFARRSSKSHIATPLVSLPVPAVVGTTQNSLMSDDRLHVLVAKLSGSIISFRRLGLTDRVVVLCPTRHKTGPGDVSPSQSLGLVWKKLNLIQQRHNSPFERNVVQLKKQEKLKPGLIAFYDIMPGNKAVYSQRKR